MNENELRALVTSTGRELLKEGLVARTWGNISARVSDTTFLITPSGLDYVRTTDEDLALVDRTTMEWKGKRKPSSEKGIHAAAYEIFPEVGFVIHTHQVYASAISVAGFEGLDVTGEERKRLGGIGKAGYGLPGTGKLKKAVRKVMEAGNHTILMKDHGALIAAETKEKAFENAALLEEICRRNLKYPERFSTNGDKAAEPILFMQGNKDPNIQAVTAKDVVLRSRDDRPMPARLDDMAQMIGRKVEVVVNSPEAVENALKKHCAVFVKDCGAVIHGMDSDDAEALRLLLEKSAITDMNAEGKGSSERIGWFDCCLMHFVYTKKYSKKKNS